MPTRDEADMKGEVEVQCNSDDHNALWNEFFIESDESLRDILERTTRAAAQRTKQLQEARADVEELKKEQFKLGWDSAMAKCAADVRSAERTEENALHLLAEVNVMAEHLVALSKPGRDLLIARSTTNYPKMVITQFSPAEIEHLRMDLIVEAEKKT